MTHIHGTSPISQIKRVILASDAANAFLIDGDPLQKQVVEELEVANEHGYYPLFHLSYFTSLQLDLLRDGKYQEHKNLSSVILKLQETFYLGDPKITDLTAAMPLLDLIAKGEDISFVDLSVIWMALDIQAAVLTMQPDLISFVSRRFPHLKIPPFRQTLRPR